MAMTMPVAQYGAFADEVASYWYADGAIEPAPAQLDSFEVTLKNIPELVCRNEAFVEAMFEQAGLEGCVLNFEVLREDGEVTGGMKVCLVSFEAVQLCFAYFDCCEWGGQKLAPVRTSWNSNHEPRSGPPVHGKRSSTWKHSTRIYQESSKPTWRRKASTQQVTLLGATLTDDSCSNTGYTLGETPSHGVALKHDLSDSESSTNVSSERCSKSDTSDDDRRRTTGSMSPSGRALWADLVDDDDDSS